MLGALSSQAGWDGYVPAPRGAGRWDASAERSRRAPYRGVCWGAGAPTRAGGRAFSPGGARISSSGARRGSPNGPRQRRRGPRDTARRSGAPALVRNAGMRFARNDGGGPRRGPWRERLLRWRGSRSASQARREHTSPTVSLEQTSCRRGSYSAHPRQDPFLQRVTRERPLASRPPARRLRAPPGPRVAGVRADSHARPPTRCWLPSVLHRPPALSPTARRQGRRVSRDAPSGGVASPPGAVRRAARRPAARRGPPDRCKRRSWWVLRARVQHPRRPSSGQRIARADAAGRYPAASASAAPGKKTM